MLNDGAQFYRRISVAISRSIGLPDTPSQLEVLLEVVGTKETYERILAENPDNAKALQKLGWLHHQDGSKPFQNQELAIQYLTKSLKASTCLCVA